MMCLDVLVVRYVALGGRVARFATLRSAFLTHLIFIIDLICARHLLQDGPTMIIQRELAFLDRGGSGECHENGHPRYEHVV